ncbi:amidohydrolase family protein [Prochlorococcus marinus]|uniref:amidohydrolase family protein n=1 Tax=Prochlorococcus marinus TaxID=1219 RepID=UPI0007B37EDD|nr:amidohydrolase family protein [Prochlorococcus marinus]KZR76766.1 Cytosine deaminase [Prochlorococcus marinus str. MIT 1320]
MSQERKGCLEAWVPRVLLTREVDVLSARVTAEGLCPLRICWQDGRLCSFELIDADVFSPKRLLLPRLAEPHAHLDKAFTWLEFPNLQGTYGGAMVANFKERQSRTLIEVRQRAERSLKLGLRHGLRAMRSHVDSLGPATDSSWEALLDLQRQWQEMMELQWVALVPIEHWSTREGDQLAGRVAAAGGLLGGVVVPPFDPGKTRDSLRQMLQLADRLGCGIDLHIDESQSHPAAGLKQLLLVLDRMSITVPITCSHASSMGLLPTGAVRRLADRMAHHRLNVVSLPLTNGWLLSKQPRRTPVERPLAPIHQLQLAGVTVAVGGDNVQDPWFPVGNFDPLALMAFSLPLAHLAPWQRLGLAPFTTAAARVMNLSWEGTLQPGSPANLLLLEAGSWAEALAVPPRRQVIVDGNWLQDLDQ